LGILGGFPVDEALNAMELRHLRYFVTLAEELSFTRAAERMHVTQSTLSHQIKQIEDEIGQRLFDRIGKRVVITDAGEALLPNATRAPTPTITAPTSRCKRKSRTWSRRRNGALAPSTSP